MKIEVFLNYLDELIPNPVCELNYNKDYELLIAVVLSAQCTDKIVNKVTKILFNKYDNLERLSAANIEDIINIVRPCGSFNKKANYVKRISEILIEKHNKAIPNNRESLESMPGVGRKTASVVLSELFNMPAIAVDTHVIRVTKRLGISKQKDNVLKIEKKLMKLVPKERWKRTHQQIVLFGRYHCTARNPKCNNCKLYGNICEWNK